jgi:hypothetical protein
MVLGNLTNFTTCNMMTGTGFDVSLLGGFSMAWIGIVILFFLIALARRWVGEEMDIPFSFVFGLIGAILPYMITIYFTCSSKWALLVGLIGGALGGFFLSSITGGDF